MLDPEPIEIVEARIKEKDGLKNLIAEELNKVNLNSRQLTSIVNTIMLFDLDEKGDFMSIQDKVNNGFMHNKPPLVIERAENVTIIVGQKFN